MRIAALALFGALGLAVVSVASANAAPAVPGPVTQASNVVLAAGGCGWHFHLNRWGHCVPNRYGYYRPRPYWPGYYDGGYQPWNRATPSDHVAHQLNRQELGRGYSGY
jgi:hypothetical protein